MKESLQAMNNCATFKTVGRKKREETRNRNIRLPARLWGLLQKAADDRGVWVNNLFWRMAEDFLVRNGYLKDENRKREPLSKGRHNGDL